MARIHGIHHITAIAAGPQPNLDFYSGVLGMRLVKRTVNQDAPDTYHLFYADAEGHPGTDLTFFPWPDASSGRKGSGQAAEVGLAVPNGSLSFWRDRLREAGVETGAIEERFAEAALPFEDPDGLGLALYEAGERSEFAPWPDSPVPEQHQIRGLHVARLWERELGRTSRFLTDTLGMEAGGEEGGWRRFAIDDGGSGKLLDVRELADERAGFGGPGTVHHVAFRVADDPEHLAVRERVDAAGARPTPVIDRFWFRSIYFREPGGVLFEIATDGPGFAVDEAPAALGEKLILPPWLEPRRAQIEAVLPELVVDRREPSRRS